MTTALHIKTVEPVVAPSTRRTPPLLVPAGPSVEELLSPRVRTRRNVRRAIGMTTGFILVLLAGNAILSRIPWPDLYGSRNLGRATWERFARSSESFDVLYLGCSYEWYGINPRVVDAEVARLGGRPMQSLNLSSSAASIVTNHLIARRVVESGRLPKLVYLDISPNATDVTQRNWVRHGLQSLGEVRDLPMAASLGSDVFLNTLLCATFSSYGRWDDAGIVAGRAVLAAPINPTLKMRFDDRGWAEWIGGDRALRKSTKPAISAPAGGTGPSAGFDVNAVALSRTVELFTSVGVEVRLLEMPMSSVAAPWDRHDGNEAYRNWIRTATVGLDVPTVRVPDGLIVDSDFFDPVHLNSQGAAKFSKWLATDMSKGPSNRSANAQVYN